MDTVEPGSRPAPVTRILPSRSAAPARATMSIESRPFDAGPCAIDVVVVLDGGALEVVALLRVVVVTFAVVVVDVAMVVVAFDVVVVVALTLTVVVVTLGRVVVVVGTPVDDVVVVVGTPVDDVVVVVVGTPVDDVVVVVGTPVWCTWPASATAAVAPSSARTPKAAQMAAT